MSSRTTGPMLKTLLFAILVPGTGLRVVPYLLLGKDLPRPVGWMNWLALVPCALGTAILLKSAWDFAVVGLGTPAPMDPPKSLVVCGFYRYVRNPMYVGVDMVLFSEALIFSSKIIFVYAILVGVTFRLLVLIFEEPTLRKRFGVSFQEYCEAVPRWIPRLTPRSSVK